MRDSLKIGILTFHNAMSYGAVLQAYALQHTIENFGYETEVINYMCEDIYNAHVRIIPKTKNIKFNIKMSLMGHKRYKWRNLLRNFRKKYLHESVKVSKNELVDLGENYSKVIAGSDQVFNDVCTKFDNTYFLDFVPDKKKYTYAASFGADIIPKKLEDEYRNRLTGFQQLSIREESGCKIVKTLLNREAECNIDPTFLLTDAEWDNVIETKTRKPYVFVFSVLKPLDLVNYAIKLGEEKGLEVLYLENYSFPKRKGLRYIGPVSPSEFIGLIKNAEYVVTNSFHGMAFSIIYKKKFIVELNTAASRNIRCEGLLKKIGIRNNEIVNGNVDLHKIEYNWKDVKAIIEEERKKSFKYLKSILMEKQKI